jgi:UDP-glucose 4-epimerase
VSWYGKAKLASEYVLESLTFEAPAMAILMVRFPNVVGPLATHGVVFDFIHKLRRSPTTLEVLGNGYQTKPYVHVAELIEGIEYFRSRLRPGVTRINIGPPDTVSVRGIVDEVTAVLGVDPTVTYQDSPYGWPGDVPRYEFDTSHMRSQGFFLRTTSREAVRRASEDLSAEIQVL